jgi:hypothetical protein
VNHTEREEETHGDEALTHEAADGVLEVGFEMGTGEDPPPQRSPQIPFHHHHHQRHDQQQFDGAVQRQVTVTQFNQRIVDDALNICLSVIQCLVHIGLLTFCRMAARSLFVCVPACHFATGNERLFAKNHFALQ